MPYERIEINLPENRDGQGTITYYNSLGNVVLSDICLGRGTSGIQNDWDNTSWWKENGNTPTGVYTGVLSPASSNTSTYGPYERLSLTPALSNDHAAIAYDGGRSGIMIHGGDETTGLPWSPLKQTWGCIRVRNGVQNRIMTLVENFGGTIRVNVSGPQKEKS